MVGAMGDTPRGERLQIMLTQKELEALDNWRFARRMPSRAAAVRELLKRGLAADSVKAPERRMRSRDFGVIGTPDKPDENPGNPCDSDAGVPQGR